jgi:hypothetical protein
MESRQQIVERIHANPTSWVLYTVGILMPLLGVPGARYFAAPSFVGPLFTPVAEGLSILGFACCLLAPCFVAGPRRRRFGLLALAALGYLAAVPCALLLTYLIFGRAEDWDTQR